MSKKAKRGRPVAPSKHIRLKETLLEEWRSKKSRCGFQNETDSNFARFILQRIDVEETPNSHAVISKVNHKENPRFCAMKMPCGIIHYQTSAAVVPTYLFASSVRFVNENVSANQFGTHQFQEYMVSPLTAL